MLRRSVVLGATLLAVSALGYGAVRAQDAPEIAVVVKIGGIPWFNALEMGIQQASKDLGVNGYMIGPVDADPATQVRHVEDLIAKGVSAIGVVPNDAQALEPVFQRAQAEGIPVITHESPDQQGNTWNIEMIDSVALGEQHMKKLAETMGEQGEYVVFVGSLTVPLHNFWADKAIEYQKANYPNMTMVADRFGVAESVDDSYRTALDMMKAHPDLKGILTFGSQGPIGAGRAIKAQGKVGQIALIGGFSPTQGVQLVKEGVITEGYAWNPIDAGYAMITVADMVIKGTPITDGMEIKGMGKVSVDPATRNIRVNNIQKYNKETIDELVALGL
jgi:simple sugar transport system substrate-binding protein